MSRGTTARQLGAGALVALLALVAVVWLNVLPHRHADGSSESHCASCQLLRAGGGSAPPERGSVHARPALVARLAHVAPAAAAAVPPAAPLPGRSPPAALS